MKRTLLLTIFVLMFGAPTLSAQEDYKRNEISVSYGTVTNTQITNLFVEFVSLSFAELDIRMSGAANFEYLRYVKRGIALGGGLTYEYGREPRNADFRCRNHYITLMPTAKFYWFNLEHVGMYSRLGLGATFMYGESDGEHGTAWRAAFQLSGICLEAGGKVRGFIELGYGTQGLALAGIKVRF